MKYQVKKLEFYPYFQKTNPYFQKFKNMDKIQTTFKNTDQKKMFFLHKFVYFGRMKAKKIYV